jgi:ABC-type phosphate transport system permease subunit
MESFKITYFDLVLFGGFLGYLLGFIPVIFGIVRKKILLGIFGLVGSVIAGAIASFVLALPTIAVFVWLITRDAKTESAEASNNDPAENSNDS